MLTEYLGTACAAALGTDVHQEGTTVAPAAVSSTREAALAV
jgi:hypothetical protein